MNAKSNNSFQNNLSQFEDALREELMLKRTNEQYSIKHFREAFVKVSELLEIEATPNAIELIEKYLNKNNHSLMYHYYWQACIIEGNY